MGHTQVTVLVSIEIKRRPKGGTVLRLRIALRAAEKKFEL